MTGFVKQNMKISDLVSHITRLQETTGLELYAVGGCIRNILLGYPCKDFDFTCKSLPEDIEMGLRKTGRKVNTVGKRYGTLLTKDEILGPIEVTTFRSEKYTKGSRKPEVKYVEELYSDLSRRDFTINSMALCAKGIIHDPFEGKIDLEKKTIRCVGKPLDRLKEDPLRVLRAVRFSVVLGFAIDQETGIALTTCAPYLLTISKQRIINELDLMFNHDSYKALEILSTYKVLNVLFSELRNYRWVMDWTCFMQADTKLTADETWHHIFNHLHSVLTKRLPEESDISTILYKDLVNKYGLHFKFSNSRIAYISEMKNNV